jgi:signal transduction histidine kinase
MHLEYDCIPFGVVVVNGDTLTIEYLNNRVRKMLNIHEYLLEEHIDKLCALEQYNSVIMECYKYKTEKRLNELELLQNRFYTAIFTGKDKVVEVYLLDTTEEVLQNRKKQLSSNFILEQEREKFLNISTELKTKCDIIEILRDREKEHLMHLKDVINNISEGLIVIDNKGKPSLCNRAAYNITNLSIGELLTATAFLKKYDVFDFENNSNNLCYMQKCIYKDHIKIKNYVVKLLDKTTENIKYLEINSNPIFNLDKELVYTIVTLKDVTETKIHQINAEEQASFVKDVVNNLDVPIAVIDYPSLTYKLMNKKYNSILKRNSEKFGSSEVLKTDLGEDLYNILICSGEKGKEYSISSYTVIDENNNERVYKLKFSPYKDSKGKVSRIHLHGLDITDEINHSRELEKVTRLKDEFFTVISHELRTPLTIIYSSLQLAYNIYTKEITLNLDKTLRRIDQNCSRLLKLINNILDLSKAEAGFLTVNNSSFDVVYATENIVSSVNLYAKSKDIELIFDTNEEECAVCMDKDKYEKILLNLLSNAIKYTPEKKQIMVILDIREEKVSLSVKDEGIGIPEDKLNYIFDRFAQVNTSLSRRAEGTGIGLSLVKKLVEYMEGQIVVTSEEGLGSEFLVEFDKINLSSEPQLEVATMDTSISDKIDIEFSDIN